MIAVGCLQLETTDGNECAVVDAGFEVFYTGQGTEDDGFEESFLTDVQGVLDSGELNGSNDQIVNIIVTDSDSYARDGGDNNNIEGDPDAVVTAGNDTSTPIIVAALVSTVLLGAAGLAYRRSQQSNKSNTSGEPSTPPQEEKSAEET
jgi:hypothetical protein